MLICRRALRHGVLLGCTAVFLSSCSTKPQMLDRASIESRAVSDFSRLFSDPPAVDATLSLSEAIARALKYNLDNRLKMMESVVAQKRVNVLDYAKLPQLAASAGYTVRDNTYGSSSLNLTSRVANFGASTSQDKGILDAKIQASWDTLDFGIAYLNAQQAGNDALIAVERQRKMLHNIIRDVQYAYWRMETSNRIQGTLNGLLVEIRQGLNNSYAAQKAKLKPLEECLEYQRAMLDLQRQMLILQRDSAQARVELTALIGLAPGSRFKVTGDYDELIPEVSLTQEDIPNLQQLALRNRPELLEEDYKSRNALTEVKKARLKMIPGLELFTSYNSNDNSFLLNDTWSSAGYRVSWNLMNLLSGPANVQHAKSNIEVADLRRMALSVAILTQVDIAVHQLHQAKEDFGISRELYRVDQGMYEQYKNRLQAAQIDQLTMVQAKARRLVSALRYSRAFAEWQNSIGVLHNSIGYHPATILDTNQDLATLTKNVESYMSTKLLSKEKGLFLPGTIKSFAQGESSL